jgi:hypothetical protein
MPHKNSNEYKYGTVENYLSSNSTLNTQEPAINGVQCTDWDGPFTDGNKDRGRCSWKWNDRWEKKAARLSYLVAHGDLPEGKTEVCHHCDRGLCIEPAHLYAGTHKQNMEDMARRGRSVKGRPSPTKGRSLPPEECAKRSAAQKGKPRSPKEWETRRRNGNVRSLPEAYQKMWETRRRKKAELDAAATQQKASEKSSELTDQ